MTSLPPTGHLPPPTMGKTGRNEKNAGWCPGELAPVWVASTGTAARVDECLDFGGTGDREASLSLWRCRQEHSCPSLTQGSALGCREALCKSSHERAQNLFFLPPPRCEKVLRKIGCISWAPISASQAISSFVMYFSSPLFSSTVTTL